MHPSYCDTGREAEERALRHGGSDFVGMESSICWHDLSLHTDTYGTGFGSCNHINLRAVYKHGQRLSQFVYLNREYRQRAYLGIKSMELEHPALQSNCDECETSTNTTYAAIESHVP